MISQQFILLPTGGALEEDVRHRRIPVEVVLELLSINHVRSNITFAEVRKGPNPDKLDLHHREVGVGIALLPLLQSSE